MDIYWLFAASVAAWVGICAYLLLLLFRQRDLRRRLDQYELLGRKRNT